MLPTQYRYCISYTDRLREEHSMEIFFKVDQGQQLALEPIIGPQAVRDGIEARFAIAGLAVTNIVQRIMIEHEVPPRSERPQFGMDDQLSVQRRRREDEASKG